MEREPRSPSSVEAAVAALIAACALPPVAFLFKVARICTKHGSSRVLEAIVAAERLAGRELLLAFVFAASYVLALWIGSRLQPPWRRRWFAAAGPLVFGLASGACLAVWVSALFLDLWPLRR